MGHNYEAVQCHVLVSAQWLTAHSEVNLTSHPIEFPIQSPDQVMSPLCPSLPAMVRFAAIFCVCLQPVPLTRKQTWHQRIRILFYHGAWEKKTSGIGWVWEQLAAAQSTVSGQQLNWRRCNKFNVCNQQWERLDWSECGNWLCLSFSDPTDKQIKLQRWRFTGLANEETASTWVIS